MAEGRASIRSHAGERSPVPVDAPVDGRTARARRTHDAIVDACIALVGEDDVRPTAPRVAARAGVSVRSIFQHFDDLEQLYAAVARRSIEQVARLMEPIDARLPLDRRIAALAAQRARLLEALNPIRRAAHVHAPFSPGIRRRLRDGHEILGAQVEALFAVELAELVECERWQTLDALQVAVDWPNWDLLRTQHGRSTAQAEQVVVVQLQSLLTASGMSDPQ